jgi:hypothetical protein
MTAVLLITNWIGQDSGAIGKRHERETVCTARIYVQRQSRRYMVLAPEKGPRTNP